MKPKKRLPRWLKRLSRVKAELRSTRFPRRAEEGLRQCLALSAMARRLLGKDGPARRKGRAVDRAYSAEAKRVSVWRRESARFFGKKARRTGG